MKLVNLVLEACVETLEDAIRAENQGAHRIELCGDLSVGGVTPTEELTLACIHALIINRRPNCRTVLRRNCAITLEFEQQSTHSLISRIYSPLYC